MSTGKRTTSRPAAKSNSRPAAKPTSRAAARSTSRPAVRPASRAAARSALPAAPAATASPSATRSATARGTENLRAFLDRKAAEYNRPSFIPDDPISIPHQYSQRQDIEIAGFFAAIFSWGNRTTIIQKSQQLMRLMDQAPYQFVRQHTENDLKKLLDFKHRTFNATDLLYFIAFFRHHYSLYESLEDAFLLPWEKRGIPAAHAPGDPRSATSKPGDIGAPAIPQTALSTPHAPSNARSTTTASGNPHPPAPGTSPATTVPDDPLSPAVTIPLAKTQPGEPAATPYETKSALSAFHHYFFSLEEDGERIAPPRTKKHISTPEKNSSCKRLNMFLRWMVRHDNNGVDFGIWRRIPMNLLICPLDLHVARVAKRFGLLTRERSDWQAAAQLTESLSLLDKEDPVKYDFALFGLGVLENF